MNSYLVRFKTHPDPQNPGGIILHYLRATDITHEEIPLKVTFADKVKLQGAFLKAGLYLHAFGHPDTGRDIMPDPNQDYEVTDQMMRDIGFDVPA
ncbi:hypothetical protein [Tunturibacter empetritectus]|uniref:Uncharacterized protein n=1 Tax=Tunturiibacter empetritectus TaxID=3069691 RepID=A0A7W8IHH3_9BACT|nr:hypothetical protein [Edaphobacter lichenicola]MBB5317252.1 hypothetical protein [Edaphobacter lichenicola]